jgi:hypothetical protein
VTRSSRRTLVPWTILVAVILWSGLTSSEAKAFDLTFDTASGKNDGPISAEVTFAAVSGGIEITVTNTASGTFAKGQAISSLSFTVGGGLSTPTFFTELKGVSFANFTPGQPWTIANGTSFDNTSSAPPVNAIDHWGFSPTGGPNSSVLLATATSPVPGSGNPHYMILPASGMAGPGNGSIANSKFYPYIIGPAEFFLTASLTGSLKSTDITNVIVGFGTGPDTTLDAALTTTVVPEISSMSMVLGVTGMLGAIGLVRRWRRPRLS